MLDVIVRGCTIYGGLVTIFSPTQPDQADAAQPAAGAGGPYKLSASSATVNKCVDKSGATVDLTTCLRAAAYSAALGFTMDRIILK